MTNELQAIRDKIVFPLTIQDNLIIDAKGQIWCETDSEESAHLIAFALNGLQEKGEEESRLCVHCGSGNTYVESDTCYSDGADEPNTSNHIELFHYLACNDCGDHTLIPSIEPKEEKEQVTHITRIRGKDSLLYEVEDGTELPSAIPTKKQSVESEELWISVEKDSDSDGTYLAYIEKTEECKAVNYYQRTVENRMNKWVLHEGERLLFWMPLPKPPRKEYA
jgi:hypothetical protein